MRATNATMTRTTGTAARQECRVLPSVRRENVGRVSVAVVSMAATVFTRPQKSNPTTAWGFLGVGTPAERGSERQADPEVRIDLRGLLFGSQVGVLRIAFLVAAARRAATARVSLSRHGALLYSTLHLPATAQGRPQGGGGRRFPGTRAANGAQNEGPPGSEKGDRTRQVLGYLPESQPGSGLRDPLRMPGIHLRLPDDGAARLRHHPHRLCSRPELRRAEEPQAVPVELPQRGGVPRGGHQPHPGRSRRSVETPAVRSDRRFLRSRGNSHRGRRPAPGQVICLVRARPAGCPDARWRAPPFPRALRRRAAADRSDRRCLRPDPAPGGAPLYGPVDDASRHRVRAACGGERLGCGGGSHSAQCRGRGTAAPARGARLRRHRDLVARGRLAGRVEAGAPPAGANPVSGRDVRGGLGDDGGGLSRRSAGISPRGWPVSRGARRAGGPRPRPGALMRQSSSSTGLRGWWNRSLPSTNPTATPAISSWPGFSSAQAATRRRAVSAYSRPSSTPR